MKLKTILVSALLWTLAVGGVAWARNVFLNGVRIDAVTGQKFEKCTVTIDANGDIFIDAPGYAVQAKDGQKAQPANLPGAGSAGASKRYWLVKEENYPGKTQYEIDIYINSQWWKRIRSDDEPSMVIELTKHLKPGPNVLHFAATKKVGEQRLSVSPEVYLRLIVGEGDMGGNNVMIESPLVQYKRTAAETENYNDEYNITVH
ncbi:MAG TPA: hypothetical protein PK668_07095 [Myxococcota bacterium]|nr:hypothetical protein [Myxococcota bacterium]HRY92389.1 hypothetical protein [Myxococcota bacterium]HSA24390.1 hypothetical protein [Myxococcota bacterium]